MVFASKAGLFSSPISRQTRPISRGANPFQDFAESLDAFLAEDRRLSSEASAMLIAQINSSMEFNPVTTPIARLHEARQFEGQSFTSKLAAALEQLALEQMQKYPGRHFSTDPYLSCIAATAEALSLRTEIAITEPSKSLPKSERYAEHAPMYPILQLNYCRNLEPLSLSKAVEQQLQQGMQTLIREHAPLFTSRQNRIHSGLNDGDYTLADLERVYAQSNLAAKDRFLDASAVVSRLNRSNPSGTEAYLLDLLSSRLALSTVNGACSEEALHENLAASPRRVLSF